MSPSKLGNALFCIFCKDTVTLKEKEFVEHMKNVHQVTSNYNILFQINFIDKDTKFSFITGMKQKTTKSQREHLFKCLFCKYEKLPINFCLLKLSKFQFHLEDIHAIHFELDLILVMHLMDTSKKIASQLGFLSEYLKGGGVFRPLI